MRLNVDQHAANPSLKLDRHLECQSIKSWSIVGRVSTDSFVSINTQWFSAKMSWLSTNCQLRCQSSVDQLPIKCWYQSYWHVTDNLIFFGRVELLIADIEKNKLCIQSHLLRWMDTMTHWGWNHDINGLLEVRQHSGKMEKRRGFFFSRLTINLRWCS